MSIFNLKNISKSFKEGTVPFFALHDINLVLSSPGFVSIVGKSGSGKSTLLNLLHGIDRPSTGELYFLGKKINKLSRKAFSNYHLNDVSIVFQHYNLFEDLTGIENVTLPLLMRGVSKKKANKKARTLLDKFFIRYLEKQPVNKMSGGEKQRIAILRAIISEPKVIFCDEPTGALDHENSLKVMDILKSISKTNLVVMVSHNLTLVNQYSDRIITLKDGNIISDKTINEINETKQSSKKPKYSSSWTSLFTLSNLKRNFKKNIFSTLSFVVGFTSIFLSIGFYYGSESSKDNALQSNLSIQYATASNKQFYKFDNSPISYEKSVRPSVFDIDDNLKDFDDIICEPNLSYLFPSYPYGKYLNQSIEGFSLVPVYDFSSSFVDEILVKGEKPKKNFGDVLVNEEFVRILNKNNDEIIDELFLISNSSTISYQTGDLDNPIIKDDYSFDFSLRVSGVVKEFSFLNTPKIYYSYSLLKKELQNTYMENLSIELGFPISFYDYISSVDEDDPSSSYSYNLFLKNKQDVNKLFSLIKKLNEEESTFQIDSNSYLVKESYNEFISSFSTALFVFVIIAFLGVNFILGMISLSTFIENKKSSAILTCLGARNDSIQNIFLTENYILVIFSTVLSVGLSILIQNLLNGFVAQKFSLFNLINIPFTSFLGIPYFLPIALLGVALLFATIFTLTPLTIYKHISVVEELRDE